MGIQIRNYGSRSVFQNPDGSVSITSSGNPYFKVGDLSGTSAFQINAYGSTQCYRNLVITPSAYWTSTTDVGFRLDQANGQTGDLLNINSYGTTGGTFTKIDRYGNLLVTGANSAFGTLSSITQNWVMSVYGTPTGAAQVGLNNELRASTEATSATVFYGRLRTNAGTYTVANAYGLYLDDAIKYGGTITNQYGLYVAAPTQGGTSNIGIYNAGSLKQIDNSSFGINATYNGSYIIALGNGGTTLADLVSIGAGAQLVGLGAVPSIKNIGAGGTTQTDHIGVYVRPSSLATNANTVTNQKGIWINAGQKDANTTVTNAYGLYVDAPTIGGTSNTGIYNGGTLSQVGASTFTGVGTYYGALYQQNPTNAQSLEMNYQTELLTLVSGHASDTTTMQIPANCIVLGVSVRVTAAPATTANFTVTGNTSTTAFQNGTNVAATLNTTDTGMKNCPYLNTAAQTIKLTYNAAPTDSNGRVRITMHYIKINAPAS